MPRWGLQKHRSAAVASAAQLSLDPPWASWVKEAVEVFAMESSVFRACNIGAYIITYTISFFLGGGAVRIVDIVQYTPKPYSNYQWLLHYCGVGTQAPELSDSPNPTPKP